MNIVSIIMQTLGPAIIGKLASSVGINSSIAQKVIGAALPTILSAIIGKVGQPGGGKALTDIIAKQDPGLLGKLGDLIGGAQQKSIAEAGMGALGTLLGTCTLGTLAGALGKFAGVNEAQSTGLIGMLAPAVLGTLGQQQKASGLDAAGLASMLMGQKDNIAAAMPADFAKLLGGSGLLDSIGPSLTKTGVGGFADVAGKVASTASNAGHAASAGAQSAGKGFNWLGWLIALVAAGLIWWFMFGSAKTPVVSLPPAPKAMLGTLDVGGDLAKALDGLKGSLGTIKDAASANAALPQLRAAHAALDKASGSLGQLPTDTRKGLAAYSGTALAALLPLINNLLANSSIGPIVKPILEQITASLTKMSKT